MRQRSNIIALIALITVAGVALYFLFSERDDGPEAVQLESNYYLKDYHLKVFDSSGDLEHEVSGKLLRQLASNNQYDLQQPLFELHTESSNWRLSAEQGWMDADMANARLSKNVKIEDGVMPSTTAATELLQVNMRQQTAATNHEVTITQGTHSLHGGNLTADFKSRTLELSPEVKGYYAP